MKQNKLFLGLATIAAVLTFASCSSDEPELNSQQPKQANTISFTSTLSNNKANTRVATTDPQASAIASGVGVGIYATLTGNGSLTNHNDAKYTSDGNGGLTLAGGTSAMECTNIDDNASLSFVAYAPTAGTWNEGKTTFTIQEDQSTDEGYLKSDLLKGTGSLAGTAIIADAKAALSFNHQLAQIKIVLQNAGQANNDFTSAAVTITNTVPSVAFNASTGTLGVESGTATDINAGTGATTYAIVVPQTITAGTQLVKVVLNGHTLLATIGNPDFTFASGQSYVFTINVGELGTASSTRTVTLGNPTITLGQWTTPDNNSIGNVTLNEKLYGSNIKTLSNCTYTSEGTLFSWTAGGTNLMTLFEFKNGEVANYKKLIVPCSNLSGGPFRIGFYIGSTFYAFGNGFYNTNSSQKEIDLSTWNNEDIRKDGNKLTTEQLSEISLSKIESIAIGGASNEGSLVVDPTAVYLSME